MTTPPTPAPGASQLPFDSVARAAAHPIELSRPAPDFFSGALLGNGGLGAVVCTRPDAVLVHFGHNNVWDIRVAEDHRDKVGTFEEVFLLGVLVRGLRAYGVSIAIGFPLLIRLLYHLYQGPLGAVWVLAFGLTFTLFYVRIGRLWPAVFAHMLWDIVPVVLADAQASQ